MDMSLLFRGLTDVFDLRLVLALETAGLTSRKSVLELIPTGGTGVSVSVFVKLPQSVVPS